MKVDMASVAQARKALFSSQIEFPKAVAHCVTNASTNEQVFRIAESVPKRMMSTVLSTEERTEMNTVTVADIKRGGFMALEQALAHGPVHLMKRNRPSAVVLSPADYAHLLAQAQRNAAAPGRSGLDLLLSLDDALDEGLTDTTMESRLAELNSGWSQR